MFRRAYGAQRGLGQSRIAFSGKVQSKPVDSLVFTVHVRPPILHLVPQFNGFAFDAGRDYRRVNRDQMSKG